MKRKYRRFTQNHMYALALVHKAAGGVKTYIREVLDFRRKGDEHVHQNLLIISLEYNENDLISMNGKPMQEWLDSFEFLAHCEWHPFGVQIND